MIIIDSNFNKQFHVGSYDRLNNSLIFIKLSIYLTLLPILIINIIIIILKQVMNINFYGCKSIILLYNCYSILQHRYVMFL